MKWLKERDELIAQTEAFVKSVTARRSQAAAAPVPMKSAPIESPFVYAPAPIPDAAARPISSDALTSPLTSPAPNFSAKPLPIEDRAPAAPIAQAEPAEASSRTEPPPIKAFAQGEVRQEIQSRVAAFQANQHRFQREREAYYNAVLTKAVSTAHRSPDSQQS